MEQIWQWGIGVIIVVQKVRSPFLDTFFIFISSFGTLIFYMIFLPFIYWCFNKKYASRILILFFISGWLNTVLKDFINHPRPYVMNETVKIGNTGGPGLPSGHAQLSLVVWGSLSLWLKNRFITYFSITIILLIALSRIYLGVHFPTDILGGWFFGALTLVLLWPFFDKIEKFLMRFNQVILIIAAVIIPGLLALILASKSSVMSMGALSGFCFGIILENRYINFTHAESIKKGFLRYLTGITLVIILFPAEKFLFNSNTPCYMMIVFIHSWIIGIWIAAGAPLLFKKFRL